MRVFVQALLTVAIGVLPLHGGHAAGGAVTPGPAALSVGDPAPPFMLAGSDGRTYKLSDFKGKQVVVIAWFAKAFTGGWTAECKSLRESGDAIRAFDVAYFAASVDTPETSKQFAQQLDLDFPLLSDPDRKVAAAYGVVSDTQPFASRWTFYIGLDGRILRIDKQVSASTHGRAIANKLAELGVAQRKATGLR